MQAFDWDWERVRSEERDGFTVEVWVHPETDFVPEDAETRQKVMAGELDWFAVLVTASRAGITLGTASIGGCCYQNVGEFFADETGYYADLVQEAVEDAQNAIERLLDDCEREQKQLDAQEGEKW